MPSDRARAPASAPVPASGPALDPERVTVEIGEGEVERRWWRGALMVG
ncbi:hypothetical protein MTF65_18400 [Streptomyces sp. APSN-46.1]|nr:hypothetical protein [Streptomyces sp. APSN-46.1]MCJ1679277.1 hypothetical protein [Streptomyces sp. APSN-46.1]